MSNYSTFDRFQGAWLGGIIGSGWGSYFKKKPENANFSGQFPSWIAERESMARFILENSHQMKLKSHLKSLLLSNSPERILSLLLPLFLSERPDKNIYTEIIAQHKFELINKTEIQEDILIWSYLIILALTNRFKFEESHIGMAFEQVLSGVKLETTSWAKKLELVSQAENNSSTLQQLTEQLHQPENLGTKTQANASLAIALSLYCFASTPRNFMLSIKRANQINSPLSSEIAMLTGTISGAYNGMGGIPHNWLFLASRARSWRQIQNTAKKLFTTWLGVYNPQDNENYICDPDVEAIAIPKIIQPRQNLQIISQKSDLS